MYVTSGTSLCIPTYKQRNIGNNNNEHRLSSITNVEFTMTTHTVHVTRCCWRFTFPRNLKWCWKIQVFLVCYTMWLVKCKQRKRQ